MADDIVNRLRELDHWLARAQIAEEAADEIEQLREARDYAEQREVEAWAQVDRLRAALERIANAYDSGAPVNYAFIARKALAGTQGDGNG